MRGESCVARRVRVALSTVGGADRGGPVVEAEPRLPNATSSAKYRGSVAARRQRERDIHDLGSTLSRGMHPKHRIVCRSEARSANPSLDLSLSLVCRRCEASLRSLFDTSLRDLPMRLFAAVESCKGCGRNGGQHACHLRCAHRLGCIHLLRARLIVGVEGDLDKIATHLPPLLFDERR